MCQTVDHVYHAHHFPKLASLAAKVKGPIKGAVKFYKRFDVAAISMTTDPTPRYWLCGHFQREFIYSPGWNLPGSSGVGITTRVFNRLRWTNRHRSIETSLDSKGRVREVFGGVFHAVSMHLDYPGNEERYKTDDNLLPIYAKPEHVLFLGPFDVTLHAFYITPRDYRKFLSRKGLPS